MTAMNFDHIYPVDVIEPDSEVSVRNVLSSPGGSGANTATGVARLGVTAAIAGVVGDDLKGASLRDAVIQEGISADLLLTGRTSDGPTGEAVILAKGKSDGGRMIVVNAGINNHYAATMTRGHHLQPLLDAMNAAKLVHFSSFVGPEELARQQELMLALDPEVVVSLNPGMLYSRLGLDRIGSMLGRADILFVYENMLDSLVRWESMAFEGQDLLSHKLGALAEKLTR